MLHRTLAPKQPRRNAKAVGMQDSSHGSTCSSITNSSAVNPNAASVNNKRKKKKKKSNKKRNQTSSVDSNTESGTDELDQSTPHLSREQPAADSSIKVSDPIDSASAMPEKIVEAPSKASVCLENAPARARMESTSSADTASSSLFLDEDSSTASFKPVASNTSQTSKPHPRNQRHVKQRNPRGNGRGKNTRDHADLVVNSRWDALKPDAQASRSNQQRKAPNKRPTNPSYGASNHRGNKPTHHNAARPPMAHAKKASATSISELSPVASTPPRNPSLSTKQHDGPHLTTPPVQPSSPSFFSELSAESPPFAPVNSPPTNIRPPPGLSLPKEKDVESTPFFLPSAFQPSSSSAFGADPMDFGSVSSSLGPPPGLGASGSATIPAGEDYHSASSTYHLPFRPSSSKLKENPFEDRESEAQIEAELQELGGAMIDNILD